MAAKRYNLPPWKPVSTNSNGTPGTIPSPILRKIPTALKPKKEKMINKLNELSQALDKGKTLYEQAKQEYFMIRANHNEQIILYKQTVN